MSQNESKWTAEWVKVLRSERQNKSNRIDLQVVKWEWADRPVLEKRRVWEKEDGDRPTKMVGLSADDLKFIYDNYSDIINML